MQIVMQKSCLVSMEGLEKADLGTFVLSTPLRLLEWEIFFSSAKAVCLMTFFQSLKPDLLVEHSTQTPGKCPM